MGQFLRAFRLFIDVIFKEVDVFMDENIVNTTEYETEEERAARRALKRAEMKKQKRRQLLIRRIVAISVPVLTILVIGLYLWGQKQPNLESAVNDNYDDQYETVLTNPEIMDEELNSSNPEGSEAMISDIQEEIEPIQKTSPDQYGPYANVESDEKEMFFVGYKTKDSTGAAYPSEEDVFSTYALLINAENGDVIVSKGSEERINPASMTKILTVLVAAEHVTDLKDTFTITSDITNYIYSHDCSAVNFAIDETVTVEDLMYGTILPSGADAAMGLAEYVAGSQEKFVELMNDKLKELGLSKTAHFTNCIGIYDENHYCTLNDMAMIMKAAVENELAKEILTAHKYTTSSTTEHPDGIEISNWFLRRIEDKETNGEVICAKTGFVNESGCCAASYERTDSGHHYICVTADAWSSWRCIYDHVAIYSTYVK